jgi:hypothetical protein
MELLVIQILCVMLTLIAVRGEQSEEGPIVVLGSFIPVIGYLIGVVSLCLIVQRTVKSKGKCFLGHDLKTTYDSEAEKWKDGRRPMRISVGGYTKYQCTCCRDEQTRSWSAF